MSSSTLHYWLAIDSGTICLLATWICFFCHWWIPCHSPRFNVPYRGTMNLSRWLNLLLICISTSSPSSSLAFTFQNGRSVSLSFHIGQKLDCQSARSVSIKHLFGVLSTAAPADLQVTCEIRGKAGNRRKQFTLPKLPSKALSQSGLCTQCLFFWLNVLQSQILVFDFLSF